MAFLDPELQIRAALPENDFEPLPAGNYLAAVIGSAREPTAAGTGEFLKFVFSVISPAEFERRQVTARLNVFNPNPKAQQIGRAQWRELLTAANIDQCADTAALHGCVVGLRLKVRASDCNYGPSNDVAGFFKPEAAPAPPAPPQLGAPAGGGFLAQPAASGSPPPPPPQTAAAAPIAPPPGGMPWNEAIRG